ncbi:MAG: ABC transporter substrate-binding protein [Desulfobacterales bacterium]|nr:ABC transporter substrate-binding protein [Desulfobacterales bacterium]
MHDRVSVAMITWRGETDAEKGFVEGLDRNNHEISIVKYHANQSRPLLHAIIERIRERRVDLIYVFGTTATQIVLSRVKDTPVVFNIVSLPVATGIIADWENSGNNSTGASNQVPIRQQLKAFKKTVPFDTLGVIFNPLEQNSVLQKNLAKALGQEMRFRLTEFPIRSRADVKTLSGLMDSVQAVYFPADSLIKSLGKEIMTTINGLRIPSMAAVQSMVPEEGVLLGLVPNYYDLGLLAAGKANQILGGKPPTRVPSSTLNHFQFWVNMKTAMSIGVQIPISTLVMADKIVR